MMAPYSVKGYYRVKEAGHYPWPCKGSPERTIKLDPSDILTKDASGECAGTFRTHTGLMCFHIRLTDDQVTFFEGEAHLSDWRA